MRAGMMVITSALAALAAMALLAQGCTRTACTAEQGSASAGAGASDLAATVTPAPESPPLADDPPEAESPPGEALGAEAASPSGAHADAAPAQPAPGAVVAKNRCKSVSPTLPMAERCAKAGAKVHTFPNTCVGRCSAIEKGMFCGQAMTDGCRCPKGQCIDDETGCCRGILR